MRAIVREIVVALAVMTASPGESAAASEATRRAVQWSVDHASKRVVVRVRISYYRDDMAAAEPTPAEIAEVNAALVKAWEGVAVNCYTLHVELVTDIVRGIASVPEDSIGIRLIYTPYWEAKYGDPAEHHKVLPYTRSKIEVEVAKEDPLSDDPAARGWPTTGTYHVHNLSGQNWLWIRDPRSFNLSHEFGHILGLQDNYAPGGGPLLPGAVPDLMFNGGDTGPRRLFAESITKVVRRGGIDFASLQCSRHIESTPFEMDLHAPLGGIGLSEVQIVADNCDWIPPSSDPQRAVEKNVWRGQFKFSPHMDTPEKYGEFEIHPVFQAGGEVVQPVSFETLSRGGEELPNMTGRWWLWETITMYEDADITARADLRLRPPGKPPAAEKFVVHAHFGDSKTGQFAFASDRELKVEVRDRACK
jgi:hypothetical protein